MGNQYLNLCRDQQTENTMHKVVPQFQQAALSEIVFKSKKAITNPHHIALPLSTKGVQIVDGFDRRVKLCFVTWRGLETDKYCVNGLNAETIESILQNIISMGFNGVRLVYSVEVVLKNPSVKHSYLSSNSDLLNKSAMCILDILINKITKSGLMVILSNQCSSPCTTLVADDGEGLWWTDKYSEFQWLDSSKHMAKRYIHNPRVVGYQLRTHVRGTNRVNPTWGDNNLMSDWRKAAQVCANEILSINEHCLIIIGGLNYGCELKSVKDYPVDQILKPRKIVYSGSFITRNWEVLSWHLQKYESFVKQMQDNLLCIRKRNHPIFINFFSFQHQISWNYLIKFLEESDIDWCFWYLDDNNALKNKIQNKPMIQRESIQKDLKRISKSNCIQKTQINPVVTRFSPYSEMSTPKSKINIITKDNVDQFLQSSPEVSLDKINQNQQSNQYKQIQRIKEQIEMDSNGMIKKPAEVVIEQN